MTIDVARAIALTRFECRALMATTQVGRIAISTRALPVIVPVCFVVDRDRIVIATGDDTTIDVATKDCVIAFETDGSSGSANRWSVHVTGVAEPVTDPLEREHLEALAWRPGPTLGLVKISTDHLSGRRMAGPDVMTDRPRRRRIRTCAM